MKLRLFITLLVFITAGGISRVAAEHLTPSAFADNYTVSNITMRDGLSHNFVEDIYRDSKGYMWIATSGSLARYDGYEFINFTPNSIARHIRSTFVRKVAEDRFGRLWVASDGGVDVIDLESLAVSDMPEKNDLLKEIARNPVFLCFL